MSENKDIAKQLLQKGYRPKTIGIYLGIDPRRVNQWISDNKALRAARDAGRPEYERWTGELRVAARRLGLSPRAIGAFARWVKRTSKELVDHTDEDIQLWVRYWRRATGPGFRR